MSQMQKPLLSIITVSYGGSEKIKNLLNSLLSHAPSVTWEWIVVDNASAKNDGEKTQKILSNTPQAHLVQLQKNLGFGGGNDEGVKFSHGEFLAFINPDIEVQGGCIDRLLEAIQKDSTIGIASPLLQTREGNLLENTWDFPTLWSLLSRRLRTNMNKGVKPLVHQINSVAWAQGSFLVMRKSFFQKLGGFDSRFFLFFEDTDLCRRSWEAGKKVVQVPQARAFHSEHRLSGKDIWGSIFRKTFWIHVISMMKYFQKWKGQSKPKIF